MSNLTDCPNCETEIDATAAATERECPECATDFAVLVALADESDPENAGPYYEVDA